MIHARLLTLVRACLAIAIFATSALVIDYENAGDPAFCGAESPCYKVRTSDVGKDIAEALHNIQPGLKLPGLALAVLVGVVAFTFIVRTNVTRNLLALVMGIGATAAAFFIYTQAKLGTYCTYCMIVDAAVILAAAFAMAHAAVGKRAPPPAGEADTPGPLDVATDSGTILAWGVGVAAITITPFIWARYPENPPLPPAIQAMQVPGKVVIVSFTDFECPHCRKLHLAVEEASKKDADIVVKRMMVPLEFHRGAMPAALAYVCTPDDNKEAIAHELYALDPLKLTKPGVLEVVQSAGLDSESIDACMTSPAARDQVDREKLLFFDELAGQGVPTTWVGSTLVRGSQTEKLLSAASRAGTTVSLPIWGMFVVGGVILLGVLVHSHRRLADAGRAPARRPDDEEGSPEDDDEAARESDGGDAADGETSASEDASDDPPKSERDVGDDDDAEAEPAAERPAKAARRAGKPKKKKKK